MPEYTTEQLKAAEMIIDAVEKLVNLCVKEVWPEAGLGCCYLTTNYEGGDVAVRENWQGGGEAVVTVPIEWCTSRDDLLAKLREVKAEEDAKAEEQAAQALEYQENQELAELDRLNTKYENRRAAQ